MEGEKCRVSDPIPVGYTIYGTMHLCPNIIEYKFVRKNINYIPCIVVTLLQFFIA